MGARPSLPATRPSGRNEAVGSVDGTGGCRMSEHGLEFGIILAAPSANDQPMGNRLDWYRTLLREGAGTYASGWLPDHLMKHDGEMLEAWTTLTWLAAEFPAYSFGHTVLCQSYRNPALLAKMAATLDYLSAGRFVMGIGAGWQAD